MVLAGGLTGRLLSRKPKAGAFDPILPFAAARREFGFAAKQPTVSMRRTSLAADQRPATVEFSDSRPPKSFIEALRRDAARSGPSFAPDAPYRTTGDEME